MIENSHQAPVNAKKISANAGNWESSLTAQTVAAAAPKLTEPSLHHKHRFWLQSVATEKGRMTVMMQTDTETISLLAPPWNARTKVHEYGGGSYCLADNRLFFIDAGDNQIYCQAFNDKGAQGIPTQITAIGDTRFADLFFDNHSQKIIAVAERHQPAPTASMTDTIAAGTPPEPENFLAAIDTHVDNQIHHQEGLANNLSIIHRGNDFYAYPQTSADGTRICWLSWNHPHMPWDESTLWLATHSQANQAVLANPSTQNIVCHQLAIAGHGGFALCQPRFHDNGDLYFVSDRDNWWNIYRINHEQLQQYVQSPIAAQQPLNAMQITHLEAEFATPLWTFRMSCYDFLNPDTLFATYTQGGQWHLAHIRIHLADTSQLEVLSHSSTVISGINADDNQAIFIGASPTQLAGVHLYDNSQANAKPRFRTLYQSPGALGEDDISVAQALCFPCDDNHAHTNDKHHTNNSTNSPTQAYGFYYPPQNSRYNSDQAPPLIVLCHGGPTGQTDNGLNYKIQFWSNRGFAVLDINYRGSTGFGRDYRRSLYGQWGHLDVQDMIAGSNYAVRQGWANATQKIIKGSSAGGYSVLAALTFSDCFTAGVSLYGIGDLELLAHDTHKFEATYLDQLIAPYPAARATYRERSPIHHTHQLNCPLLLFQGSEDKVVPPNQAHAMAAAVKTKGIACALVEYDNEGHGFRDPKNISHMMAAELYFYQQIFQLTTTTINQAPITLSHSDTVSSNQPFPNSDHRKDKT